MTKDGGSIFGKVDAVINLKTVSLQLIDGDADGIKLCHVVGSTLLTVVVPRDLIASAKTLPDIPARGVYYLLDDNKGRLRRVYAGQTTQGIDRLDSHNSKKDWWNRAVMFLSPDNEFSLDVVSGLEKEMIRYIKSHGSYQVDNSVIPTPYVSPYNESFIAALHEDILFRMALLGFDLDAVGDDNVVDAGIFHTSRRHIDAYGRYDARDGRFIVLSGSQVDLDIQPGTKAKPYVRLLELRQSMCADGGIIQDGHVWRTTRDTDFTTPSAAAVFVLGGSQNGWTEWVSSEGKTLSSVYRES